MKIFGIGAHKTASTSVRNAIEALGFKIEKGLLWYNKHIRILYYQGNYKPIYDVIAKYDAIKD